VQEAAAKARKAGSAKKTAPGLSVRKLTESQHLRAQGALAGFIRSPVKPAEMHGIKPEHVAQFHDVASALRAGHGHAVADEVDKAMKPLSHDVVVTRNLPASTFGKRKIEDLAGKRIVDKAYTPAALHQESPNEGGVTLHIVAPKGTKAVLAGDNELWLERDAPLAIQSVEPNEHGGYDVHAVVIPKAAKGGKAKKAGPVAEPVVEPGKKTGSPVAHDSTLDFTPTFESDTSGEGSTPAYEKLLAQMQAEEKAAEQKSATMQAKIKAAMERPASQTADKEFSQRMGAATTGEDALMSVPKSLVDPEATGINGAQEYALTEYKGNGYLDINGALRRGEGTTPKGDIRLRDQIGLIDSVMKTSQTDRDVALMRGIIEGNRVFGMDWNGDLSGVEWTEHGYVSTTSSVDIATEFATGGGAGGQGLAMMKILVPKGTGAVQLSGEEYESELLLQRGLRMRVVSDSGPLSLGDEEAGGIRTIEVEVVPA
jgi:hypothetical protein